MAAVKLVVLELKPNFFKTAGVLLIINKLLGVNLLSRTKQSKFDLIIEPLNIKIPKKSQHRNCGYWVPFPCKHFMETFAK